MTRTLSRHVTFTVLVTFVTASVVVPAAAARRSAAAVADAGERDPRSRDPKDSGGNGKGERRKPPRRDDGGTRPPRGKGDPPPEHAPPEPPGWVDIYGVHEPYYDYYELRRRHARPDYYTLPDTESSELVGLYGLAATTVMVLNLLYYSDADASHDALGVTGLALGATGVIWSFNADHPWERRTLFLAGLFSVGFALLAWSSDEPDEAAVPYDPGAQPAAGVSLSF